MKWVFSDPHFHHRNIVSAITNWREREGFNESQVRDFQTVEEMNQAIIDGINKYVEEDDELYCLGDWAFTSHAKAIAVREEINCNNIHLIFGNHDGSIIRNQGKYRNVFKTMQFYKEMYMEIDGERRMFCLFHYSQRVWNKSHRGSFHLFGHSHGSLDYLPHGRSMDVGIDSLKKLTGEYRPITFEEAYKHLKIRKPEIIDHHKSSHNDKF